MSRQFLLFLLTGGAAAALNWGSRFLFALLMPFEAAVVAAFMVGLLSGFVLMRSLVFEGGGKPVLPQFGRYVLVNLAALMQTVLISAVLARWGLVGVAGLGQAEREALAHLAGVLVPVVTSYFGHKLATFR